MKVIVDQAACEGHAKCVQIASDLFKMDETGVAQVLVPGELNPEQLKKADMAARLCPTKAIHLAGAPPGEKPGE